MFQLLHFSDCHLFADPTGEIGGVCSAEALERILASARAWAGTTHMAIITGDLSQDGEPESYALAERMFAPLHVPVYAVPGNHDPKGQMQLALTGHPIAWQRSVVAGGWHMIFLDSTHPDPDNPAGELPAKELSALEETLQTHPELPTLIALHHQPVPLETPWMNRMALANPDDFFAILTRHPWVKCVLFGHVHHPFDGVQQGIRLLSAPSTCVQFATGTENPVFITDSPGYRWLRLYPDGLLETGVNGVQVHSS
ncbi:MAG: phosphodiesterase [Magnetococcus sp. MYC-9]